MPEPEIRRPKFLTEEMENDPFYYSVPDPYKNPPPFPYNIHAICKYATETGKAVVDMSLEEIEQFRVLPE